MNLNEIKARLAKATIGTWSWDGDPSNYDKENEAPWLWASGLLGAESKQVLGGEIQCCKEDADFIAHSKQDIASLIQEVERLNGEVKMLQEINDHSPDWWEKHYKSVEELKASNASLKADVERQSEYIKSLYTFDQVKEQISHLEKQLEEVKIQKNWYGLQEDLFRMQKECEDLYRAEIASLKADIVRKNLALTNIYHAIRGCSEIMIGDGFGDIKPKNTNLDLAYQMVKESLSTKPLLSIGKDEQ